MKVTPFIAFQYEVRRVCSDLLHHICVTASSEGAIMDSNVPRRKRRAARDLKFVQAAAMAAQQPQPMTAVPMTFP